MAKKKIEIQSLEEKAFRNPLSLRIWKKRRRAAPIPNRMASRATGWTSLNATFVAIKENPQKMIAHRAGQDKIFPPFSFKRSSLLITKGNHCKPPFFFLDTIGSAPYTKINLFHGKVISSPFPCSSRFFPQ